MDKTLVLGLIVCVILGACLPFEVMQLSAETADAVRGAIRASAPAADFADAFTLFCTVNEGDFCDVVTPRLTRTALSRDLSKQVIRDVGPKYVEHSDHTTAQIHCERRSEGLTSQWKCEIDRGSGWKPLPVP